MDEATKSAEVRRILERYFVEIVERYDLCPWARAARLDDEIAVEVLLGAPSLETWVAAARRALARPSTRVAMIVAPELAIESSPLREIRNHLTRVLDGIGVADFHPDAPLDLGTPPRLVPFLRRSPDPLLQLVPLALLDNIRTDPMPDLAYQAQMLRGEVPPLRDVGAEIAAANHASVSRSLAEIERTNAAIAADRQAAYTRVGLSACRSAR